MKILPDYPSLRGLVIAALVVTVALYFFGGGIETMVAACLVTFLLLAVIDVFNNGLYPGIVLKHVAMGIHFAGIGAFSYYLAQLARNDVTQIFLSGFEWFDEKYLHFVGVIVFVGAAFLFFSIFSWAAEKTHGRAGFESFFDRIIDNGALASYFLGDDNHYVDGYHEIRKTIYFKLLGGISSDYWSLDTEMLANSGQAEGEATTYRFNLFAYDSKDQVDSSNDLWLGSLCIRFAPINLDEGESEASFLGQFEAASGGLSKLTEAVPGLESDQSSMDKLSLQTNGDVLYLEEKAFIFLNLEINGGQVPTIIFIQDEYLYTLSAKYLEGKSGASQILGTLHNLRVRGWRSMGELIAFASVK